jgi:hypothetical protein
MFVCEQSLFGKHDFFMLEMDACASTLLKANVISFCVSYLSFCLRLCYLFCGCCVCGLTDVCSEKHAKQWE